jgi:hypothetical protein
MICPRCKTNINETAKFCNKCGLALHEDTSDTDRIEVSSRGWRPPSSKNVENDYDPRKNYQDHYANKQRVDRDRLGSIKQKGKPKTSRKIVGFVRNFKESSEMKGLKQIYVWSFYVERYDKEGNRLAPIPVQMKGNGFRGMIREGDKIKVSRKYLSRKGNIKTNKVYNQTTHSKVRTKGFPPMFAFANFIGWIMWWGFMILIIALIIYIISIL